MLSTIIQKPKTVVAGLIGLAVLGTFLGGFFTVKQNEVAFVTRFDRVINAEKGPLEAGLHFKLPFIDDPDKISITTDTFLLPEKKAYTKDTQQITLQVGVTYKVPKTAAYHLLYEIGKSGNVDIHTNIINLSNEVTREVISRYEVNAIAGDGREKIVIELRKELSELLQRILKIEVEAVQIAKLDFSPEYLAAINKASIARTSRIEAEQLREKALIDAQTTVTNAKALADSGVARAEGEARSRVAAAKGEAESIELQAKAKAAATELQGLAEAKALKARIDAAGGPAGLVEQIKAEAATKWNGSVPQFSMGNGGNGNGVQMPIIMPMPAPSVATK